MAKRKKKRAKKSNPSTTPKRRGSSHKRKRAHSPKRSSKRRVRRATAHNPKRTTHKRRLSHKRNPSRTHHKRRRARKRNPAIPVWAMGLLAGLAGLATYTVLSVGTFQITKAMDPKLAALERNRYIIGGAGILGGVALAFVSPLIGAGIAGASAVFALGTPAVNATAKLFEPKPTAKIAGVIGPNGVPYGISGVFGRDGRPVLSGVVDSSGQPQFMGAPWSEGAYY